MNTLDLYNLVEVRTRKPSFKSRLKYSNFDPVKVNEFVVLKNHCGNDSSGRPLSKIRFSSGFEKEVRRDTLDRCRDPYLMNSSNGYIGTSFSHIVLPYSFSKRWSHMMDRCYNVNCKEYPLYGGRGISVCVRWHDRSVFLRDCIDVDGFENVIKNPSNYELDKDHFQSGIYSKETCIWIRKDINIMYSSENCFIAQSPDNDLFYHISVPVFSKKHNLNAHCVSRCIRGDREHHKGWRFKKTKPNNLRFGLV